MDVADIKPEDLSYDRTSMSARISKALTSSMGRGALTARKLRGDESGTLWTPSRKALRRLAVAERQPRRDVIMIRLTLERKIDIFPSPAAMEARCVRLVSNRIPSSKRSCLIQPYQSTLATVVANDIDAYDAINATNALHCYVADHDGVS